MIPMTVKEIAKASKGKILQGDASVKVRGVCINSKILKKGDLFIAIKGKRLDGHAFLKSAFNQGAAAILICDGYPKELASKACVKKIPIIKVKDTTRALGYIARHYRDQFDVPVIAITGSAGKTTTKNMVAGVLSAKYRVLKNEGTHNNHIGVPMTLLQLKPSHEIVIVELGTNHFGEIRWLTSIARPTAAILTNIGESHLEFLKSPGNVFREKSQLIKGMKPQGLVFINTDDKYLKRIPKRYRRHRVVSFGTGKGTQYQATDIQVTGKQTLSFKVNGSRKVSLPVPSVANVYNALAAISCGRAFNISYNTIINRIRSFHSPSGRQDIIELPLGKGKLNKNKAGCWIIDDTYNANPVSLRSALKTLFLLKVPGRRFLVCADMLELGSSCQALHASVGRLAAKLGINAVLTHGKASRFLTAAAKKENPAIVAVHCATVERLHKEVLKLCRPGDAILVKGSRGMHMERTIQFLSEYLPQKLSKG